jgi:hypothetical protein
MIHRAWGLSMKRSVIAAYVCSAAKRIAFSVCLFLFVGHVPASAITAGELLGQCEQLERSWVIKGENIEIYPNPKMDKFEVGKCWGYLNAHFDLGYLRLFDPAHPTEPLTNPLDVCLPTGMRLTQLIRMVPAAVGF